ncbi:mitochondrial ribosomal protein L9 [Leptinotarsa decemlineata]|uniref:mitochondrial ribosomal protein L9 n=1 Tax=Leptinotarsa decemlineata TaxID=7539 RepID=UPI003D30BC3F
MWKTLVTTFGSPANLQKGFLVAKELSHQQLRTTYILKRKFAPQLHQKGKKPKTLRSRHYVYELVEDTTIVKQPEIDLILTSYVEGYGNIGERVSVRPNFAYNNLLLPGLAVYPTPENTEKYKDFKTNDSDVTYSSANALYTLKALQRMTLSVIMNKEMPWTIKPWHIKVSFRKCGYVVPEEAIAIPEKPISGPNMDLENKEFAVTVTINKQEKVDVRCRIHHWSTDVVDRIPYTHEFWEIPTEPILPDQESVLEAIPKRPPVKHKVIPKN